MQILLRLPILFGSPHQQLLPLLYLNRNAQQTPKMVSSSYTVAMLGCIGAVQALYAGEFSLNCAPLTIQRSDPIVSPGVASNHVHCIAGGNSFSRSMPGALDATNSPQTSCNVDIDHSNYWVPCLYHINSNNTYSLVPYTGNVSHALYTLQH